MAMNITSEEINFLVYKYLLESGYHHSAFSFYNESTISKSEISASTVPHGTLVSTLQKGLQYIEVETHLQDDGTEVNCSEPFSLITEHVCQIKKRGKSSNSSTANSNLKIKQEQKSNSSNSINSSSNTIKEDKDVKMTDSEEVKGANKPTNKQTSVNSVVLEHIPPVGHVRYNAELLGGVNNPNSKMIDVTTLDWNPEGNLLATGCYDGISRIWNTKGDLLQTLAQHQAPIFSLKWNKKGNYLVSGSVDKTAIVWDIKTGQSLQQFEFHTAPTLDIDWRNNTQFATCSTDKMIYVCEIGKNKPIQSFQGHEDEINSIRWDPTGNLLASCSDDHTIKIWSMKSGECLPLDLSHTREIYTIRWSPCGPGSKNPNKNIVLASASFDTNIKLWDIETGSCLHTLENHTDPVYTVAFSPNGEYLASGSFDKSLHIWSVKDGSLIRTYRGTGGIFEVCWNSVGDKVAACFSDSTVAVIDFKV
ncbi:hypothetical protein DLAC_10055 [Tieghemostelium lacteum]|uniref:WD40 repeat-containing protein n=1 Tax=Tieghemostelium lacteum TaxID=361077 RepID=A0A151Z6H3_TIELA|nr:hypothetical protein DLAC_10055 [Tieghemostelium lacteum]|eukprot:KYQ89394.1 hypothetical protein DLAC_10055 [Tieghemostelium lacteum]